MTEKIVSQMNKVLFASCVNVIALPIVVNVVLTDNLYGNDGLSGMVFDYQISVIIGLVIKLLDPMFIIKKIIMEIKLFRNFYIQKKCLTQTDINPELGVPIINKFYEGADAQLIADNAFSFLQYTDALIVDLRENKGGSPDLVVREPVELGQEEGAIYQT